ncbi:hypothetical protein [Paraburkholderia sp.]|uniref:hypothetical protein n=1 Tax=Paraburkholderia sp. TaxID=1926495 RepID=UPI003C7A9AF1
MTSKSLSPVSAVTVSIRKGKARHGETNTYQLNGSTLRDILVDGRWVTVAVSPEGKAAQSN